jgi:hypothetical protein
MADVVAKILGVLLQLAVLAGLVWLARRGRYAVLAEPDPQLVPSFSDWCRYGLSSVASLAFGVLAAYGLASVAPHEAAGVLARIGAYDQVAGRWLGAGCFGLGCAAWLAYPLAARWVAPGPLQHILWRSAAQWRRLDPRPITRSLARIFVVVALVVQFAIRDQHTTFGVDGVRWCDYPWQAETLVAWDDVTAVELVATFPAMTGKVIRRLHLRLQVRDGEPLVVGRFVQRSPAFWEAMARLASEQAGVVVARVEK